MFKINLEKYNERMRSVFSFNIGHHDLNIIKKLGQASNFQLLLWQNNSCLQSRKSFV